MPATIKIKNSSTSGAVPTASDLVQGELAVNVTDKRIFTENASGTVVELGTNPSILTLPDGSASAPTLTNDGDTNTGIFFPAADTIAFAEGGVEAMRLDSSGNMGLGTTSPSTRLHAKGASGTTTLRLEPSSSTTIYTQVRGVNGDLYLEADAGNAEGSSAMIFTVDASERMRLDASGNLLVGTTSATYGTSGRGVIEVNGSSTSLMALKTGGSAAGYMYHDGTNMYIVNTKAAALALSTDGTERARIDTSGNLLVGTTTARSKLVVEGGQISVGSTGSTSQGIYLYINNALSDNSYLSRGSAGSGTTTWYIGNQAITTSSDQRLKADIKPSERNAIDLLNQWEIVDHTWNDPSDQCENNRNSRGVWTGVVAQQVQQVTPWLVNKPIEDVNEDGSINPWTMDFGYAVPLLVKAFQEQQAIITALTARIEALEQA
jgi:hypothetical protein